jgi:hypothetical protein
VKTSNLTNTNNFVALKTPSFKTGYIYRQSSTRKRYHAKYCLIAANKMMRMRWAGHVARMGEKRNVYRLLVGKKEGKRPLGRPRRRWMDNIKMDLLEIGLNVVDWMDLAQDMYRWRALGNSVMNLGVP